MAATSTPQKLQEELPRPLSFFHFAKIRPGWIHETENQIERTKVSNAGLYPHLHCWRFDLKTPPQGGQTSPTKGYRLFEKRELLCEAWTAKS